MEAPISMGTPRGRASGRGRGGGVLLLLPCSVAFFLFFSTATALLSPKGVNFEVQALMGLKNSLVDPHGVLDNWDSDAVDPCSWTMITCSAENLVIGLMLQNNNITGPIPSELGKLPKLQTLDLSNNFLSGEIPPSLGHLRSLQYMRLNNNSLHGELPESLANMTQLTFLDLSYNNISGPIPRILAKSFNIIGNPLVCTTGKEPNCHGMTLMPISMNLNGTEGDEGGYSRGARAAFGKNPSGAPYYVGISDLSTGRRRRGRGGVKPPPPPPLPSAVGSSYKSLHKLLLLCYVVLTL
ncbi:protein NSP-INTERACTING KINASE 1-like isoform X2 [Arachis ipaensis]|uniref:protein NSP-INTERACTING KINASE 1-like isoform X2 n=1 Tax=Arachis ipaensis TaxID=130454 RepID=UPI000A2B01D6|nr:protein NSP-INTERACTING KINASE 1-like isoform X2 [Arachis ipaensis]